MVWVRLVRKHAFSIVLVALFIVFVLAVAQVVSIAMYCKSQVASVVYPFPNATTYTYAKCLENNPAVTTNTYIATSTAIIITALALYKAASVLRRIRAQ
jgi:hypothetical protein